MLKKPTETTESLPFLYLAFLCHICWLSITLRGDLSLYSYNRYQRETCMYIIIYNHKTQISIGQRPYRSFPLYMLRSSAAAAINKSACSDYVDKELMNCTCTHGQWLFHLNRRFSGLFGSFDRDFLWTLRGFM